MASDDIASNIMQPAMARQLQRTARVQRRKALQAKFFLVLATTLFSSYATYTTYRYLTLGEFNAISLLTLFAFAAIIVDRWRAV